MRYCINCGAELSDESKFCSKCGTPVDDKASNQEVKSADNGSDVFQPEMIDFSKKNKKNKKKKEKKKASKKKLWGILIGLVLVAVAIGVGYIKYNASHPTIDLSPYMEIEFEGYVDQGKIKYGYPCLNMEKLSNEMNKVGATNIYVSAYDFGTIEVLKDDRPCDGENLKEGDVLTLRMDFDRNLLYDKTGIRFKGEVKTVEVKLSPLSEIDVFEDFTPQIKDTSPAGHIRTDLIVYGDSTNTFVSECYRKYGTLPFDLYINDRIVTSDDPVKVGDVVEVRINENGRSYLKEKGLTPSEEKKDLELTLAMFEHGAWVTDPEKIDASTEQILRDGMKSAADSLAAKNGYKGDPQFIGMAYCSLKEHVNLNNTKPAQYFVYKIENKSTYSMYGDDDEYDYILISHDTIYEQIENYDTEDAVENPGKVVQYVNTDENSYGYSCFNTVDDLRALFSEMSNRYDYTMDSTLKELINWNK